MADKTETPKKVVVASSKCFVGFGNSRLILLKIIKSWLKVLMDLTGKRDSCSSQTNTSIFWNGVFLRIWESNRSVSLQSWSSLSLAFESYGSALTVVFSSRFVTERQVQYYVLRADMCLHILFCGLTHIRLLFKANTVGNCHVSLLDTSAIFSDQCQYQCCFSDLRIHTSFSLINRLDRKFWKMTIQALVSLAAVFSIVTQRSSPKPV